MIPIPLKASEVDARLDRLAEDTEAFEENALEWIDELEAEGRDLEIADSSAWRAPVTGAAKPSTSFENQFRAEVDRILPLDREEEARLARRVEFARLRLRRRCEREGVEPDEWLEQVGRHAADYQGGAKGAHPALVRRAAELHALRTEMVERNLYLVLINVERYAQTGASRTDLIQEGNAALFRAVDGFDWRRGLLFRTYAVHWLNQAFRNYLYNFGSTVRVPVYLQKALKHINQAQIKLGDPSATAAEIAETADLDEKLVSSALAAARASYSLDGVAGDDGSGNRLRDLLVLEHEEGPYTTRLEDVTLETGLREAMERLSDRERLVVSMRFGLDDDREHTLAEVARELGVSVERVRQIQVRAIAKLNTPTFRREMDPFLN